MLNHTEEVELKLSHAEAALSTSFSGFLNALKDTNSLTDQQKGQIFDTCLAIMHRHSPKVASNSLMGVN
ncbi:hypothetical protein I6Y99_004195 [Vibrio parahaemolyticus]|nr:hypothetical protein [Vibrio parahaemolyticus]